MVNINEVVKKQLNLLAKEKLWAAKVDSYLQI
jgi:hypothetical protein